MEPIKLIRDFYIGKVLVDTEFSSKGDKQYYEDCGLDYPGFDGVIVAVGGNYTRR